MTPPRRQRQLWLRRVVVAQRRRHGIQVVHITYTSDHIYMVKHERQNGSGPKAICTSFNRKTRIWPNGVRRHVRYFRYGRPASLSLFVCASIFFKRNIPHKKDKGNHPLMHACQDHTKICSLFFSHFIGITIYGVFHLYLFLFSFRWLNFYLF